MTTRLYIGDSHGKFHNFNNIVVEALSALSGVDVAEVISVGDFGYWPRLGLTYRKCGAFEQPVRWIDGNHEDHMKLSHAEFPNSLWECSHIPRGTIDGGVFFMGGATSIDAALRTIDIDWFEEENISYADFYRVEATLQERADEVNVMCAHDSVMSAYDRLICGNKGERRSDCNAEALEQLFGMAKPKAYVHGHHHVSDRYQIDGTEFASLDRCCRNNPDFRACTIAISDDGEILDW
ncbi:MAG: hypothetical protein GY818_04795 [Planctomycetaceae bacterium]|nr:hypothetical protein [Planctomycetaceae bacterium]